MKIVTWNINGLKAWLYKGCWNWIEENQPDIVCLQEIKARLYQNTSGFFDGRKRRGRGLKVFGS